MKLRPALLLITCLILVSACADSGSSDSEQSAAVTDQKEDLSRNQGQTMPAERESSDQSAEASAVSGSDSMDPDTEGVHILFLGDSITAGFGLNKEEAFPSLVNQQLLDAGYSVHVTDGGVSGGTSTGGLNQMEWQLQNRVDILFLELGGNDGLRGIDLALTRSNLGEIIEVTRERYPNVVVIVAGMIVPPNLGHEYTTEFREIFPSVSEEYDTRLIPFIGEGLLGVEGMVQNDGIHPTAPGHLVIAETVFAELEPIVRSLSTN